MLVFKKIMIVLFSLFCGFIISNFIDGFIQGLLLTEIEKEFFKTCFSCDMYYYGFSIVVFWASAILIAFILFRAIKEA